MIDWTAAGEFIANVGAPVFIAFMLMILTFRGLKFMDRRMDASEKRAEADDKFQLAQLEAKKESDKLNAEAMGKIADALQALAGQRQKDAVAHAEAQQEMKQQIERTEKTVVDTGENIRKVLQEQRAAFEALFDNLDKILLRYHGENQAEFTAIKEGISTFQRQSEELARKIVQQFEKNIPAVTEQPAPA